MQVSSENSSKKIKKRKVTAKIKADSEDESCSKTSAFQLIEEETQQFEPQWHDYELLVENLALQERVAKNVINLFENGNEIPFIARYRKNETDNMSPEQLREAKECYENVKSLKQKMQSVLKALSKAKVLSDVLLQKITVCRDMEEIEHLVC